MKFVDLKQQYRVIEKEINVNIRKVLEHGIYIMGPEVTELEQQLARFSGVRHAISCSSGTDALLMPLLAWQIGRGDAVFTTTFTFAATAEVIALLGATPVFVDIDPRTFNIDPSDLEEKIEAVLQKDTLRPRAVITVDLFGLPADYDKILPVARKYGLKVLEDAAQSYGSRYWGKRAGGLADAAATSFFPAKPLGCYGDGGAVLTDDDDLADKIRSIRVHGQGKDKYDNVRLGINGRLDTIQAAILLAKLGIFDKELDLRDKVAALYSYNLDNIVVTPMIPEGSFSSWAQYSILAHDKCQRDELMGNLNQAGIPTAIYYRKPLHLQTAYRTLNEKFYPLPVAEDICERIFSLPMHPYLSGDEIESVCSAIKQ